MGLTRRMAQTFWKSNDLFGRMHGVLGSRNQMNRTGPVTRTEASEGPVMPGNPLIFSATWQSAAAQIDQDGPMALRPRLATGLPLSEMKRP